MNVTFLSVGGNTGDRLLHLNQCCERLQNECGTIFAKSGIYETDPWGTKSSNKYLNMCIGLHTDLQPRILLDKLLEIERSMGRMRNGQQYADREIDIDILLFNSDVINEPHFHVPHPRMHLRRFVLHPLSEIAPQVVIPGSNKTISEILVDCNDESRVRKYNPLYICIEGNIGSGKTSLCKQLCKDKQSDFIAENYEDIGLLSLFYENPQPYAFALEFSFLLSRRSLLADAYKYEQLIADFSIYRSLWFAKVNLPAALFEKFSAHFWKIEQNLRKPDLFVYLRAGEDVLQQNIKRRNRKMEDKITNEYLHKIEASYESGIHSLSGARTLRIDITSYDAETWSDAGNTINNYLKENFAQ